MMTLDAIPLAGVTRCYRLDHDNVRVNDGKLEIREQVSGEWQRFTGDATYDSDAGCFRFDSPVTP